MPEPRPHRTKSKSTTLLWNRPFLTACRENRSVTPIWLMRQAGRYMAEYRAIRSKVPFLELCKPRTGHRGNGHGGRGPGRRCGDFVRGHPADPRTLGFELEFAKGEGPVIHNPVTRPAMSTVFVRCKTRPASILCIQAVRLDPSALKPATPLIGFAGAPFTLACYAIEGGVPSLRDRQGLHVPRSRGLERLDGATRRLHRRYLNAQIDGRRPGFQIFDSWVGMLGPEDYRRFVQPHMNRLFPARSHRSSDPFRHRHRIAAGAATRRRRFGDRTRLAG